MCILTKTGSNKILLLLVASPHFKIQFFSKVLLRALPYTFIQRNSGLRSSVFVYVRGGRFRYDLFLDSHREREGRAEWFQFSETKDEKIFIR